MKEAMKIKSVLVFDNGNIAVFDKKGQIPTLQIGWPELWAALAESNGYDPDGVVIETSHGKFKLFRTESSWNWRVL